MRRSRGFARRAAAFVLAVSMSASILPSALAAGSTPQNISRTVSENSVDELGNIDLSDEVFEVPAEPKAAAAESTAAETGTTLPAESLVVSRPETADVLLVEGDEWLGDLVRADGDYDDQVALQLGHTHQMTYQWTISEATCTKNKVEKWKCKLCWGLWGSGGDEDREIQGTLLGHKNSNGVVWKAGTDDGWIEVPATCGTPGKRYRNCTREGCNLQEEVDPKWPVSNPATGEHTEPVDRDDPDNWIELSAPTCTEKGERVLKCEVCKKAIPGTEEPIEPLGHDFDQEAIDELLPCQTGTFYCRRTGCSETYTKQAETDHTPVKKILSEAKCEVEGAWETRCSKCKELLESGTIPALQHVWSDYREDGALGCQAQTESKYCLLCGAKTGTRDIEGASVRKHKFTHYTTTTPNIEHEVNLWGMKFTIPVPTPVVSAACDYGCGEVDELDAYDYPAYAALAQASSDATESLAKSAVEMIENALEATRTAVQEATTREEAIASLDQIYTATRSQLLAKGGVDVEIHLNINGTVPDWVPVYGGRSYNIPLYNDTVTVPITEEMVDSVLGQLKAVIDNAKSMLQESFLSMEAVQVAVTKITDTVLADCADPNGMQKSLHELAFYPVYKSAGQAMNIDLREGWEKHPSDSTESALGELILRLAGSAVNDEEGWQPFVEAIIDNVSDLLIDYIRNHPKYGKYLNNSLGEELLAEMRVLIRKELADDETFVQAVRGVLGTALDNAADGVRKGWSDKKVLENLRADLLQVNDVVEDELLLLSDRLGDLVDETIQAKFRKWLPFGNLTAWIGEWVGSFAKDLVAREIAGETGSVRSTIEKYINFITCPGHDYKRVQTRDPSCVEDGELSWRCVNCQWTRTDDRLTVEKLGHIVVTDEAVEPTETTDGLTEGTHCIRCGKALVPQQVIPALQPNMEQQLLCTGITATVAKSLGYESTQKLNAAIDTTLSKAGFAPADSQRYFVQVQTNLDVLQDAWDADPGELPSRILPNDRYPEQGITGYLPRPAQTAGKNCSWYALQLLTTDWDGHRAGEMIAAPLVPTEKGLQITVYAQAVVVLAWQENA